MRSNYNLDILLCQYYFTISKEFKGSYSNFLLNSQGLRVFSINDYGDFKNGDHIYITGERVNLSNSYYVVKVETMSSSTTPTISFDADSQTHKISISSVDPNDVLWSDILIIGDCNTSDLGEYVTDSDVISECSGNIILTYTENEVVLADYEFEELKLYCTGYETNGNILIQVTGGSLDPANAIISIGTSSSFGLYIYDP